MHVTAERIRAELLTEYAWCVVVWLCVAWLPVPYHPLDD